MKLKPPSIEDSNAISTVHVRSWQAAYAHILPASFLSDLSIADRSMRWARVLAANESAILIARSQAGEITGFVGFGNCRDADAGATQGEILALYATPEVWGRGIGRELLSQALSRLRSAGFSTVSLWVLATNHRAIRFYRAAGFIEVAGSSKEIELGGARVEEICLAMRIGG